jgi:hypothetical protein
VGGEALEVRSEEKKIVRENRENVLRVKIGNFSGRDGVCVYVRNEEFFYLLIFFCVQYIYWRNISAKK